MPRGLGYHIRCSPEPRGAKTSAIESLIEEEKRGDRKKIERKEKEKKPEEKKDKKKTRNKEGRMRRKHTKWKINDKKYTKNNMTIQIPPTCAGITIVKCDMPI